MVLHLLSTLITFFFFLIHCESRAMTIAKEEFNSRLEEIIDICQGDNMGLMVLWQIIVS